MVPQILEWGKLLSDWWPLLVMKSLGAVSWSSLSFSAREQPKSSFGSLPIPKSAHRNSSNLLEPVMRAC